MLSSPVFIVGAGRSGTTLVRSLLSAHSRMVVTPETYFLSNAEGYGGLNQRDPARCEAFWRSYVTNQRFLNLEVEPERCQQIAAQCSTHDGMAALFLGTLEAYRERHGKPRIGEKTPNHVRFVSSILANFPDARVLIMQRDPRAVVASQLRMPWSSYHAPSLKRGLILHTRFHRVAWHALVWNHIYARILPGIRNDQRVHVVKYEDLVKEPAPMLQVVCEFLGETFEETMLTERSKSTVPEFAALDNLESRMRAWTIEHHQRSLQAIDGTALDAWKMELHPSEVALIEGRCAGAMREAGYKPTCGDISRRTLSTLATPAWLMARVERRARRMMNQPVS